MGLLFLILYPAPAPVRPVHLCHTPSLSHIVTHHLCRTPSFTHPLCHTLSFAHHHSYTPLCHTPSFTTPSLTHIFVTHHLSHTTLSHTALSHTIFHTPWHHLRFTWQALHFAWQACSGGALGCVLVARGAAPLCMAGVALGDIDVPFPWQFTLRGRRGTWWHPPSICVVGVALGDIHLHFAWQAWCLWHGAGSGGALGRVLVARGAAPLCVAGVALGDIGVLFAWQAWYLWHWAGSGGAFARFSRPGRRATLRGRRGTYELLGLFGLGGSAAKASCLWSLVSPCQLTFEETHGESSSQLHKLHQSTEHVGGWLLSSVVHPGLRGHSLEVHGPLLPSKKARRLCSCAVPFPSG